MTRLGGITGWLKMAALAEQAHRPLSPHLLPEIGVHLACGLPQVASVEYMPWLSPLFTHALTSWTRGDSCRRRAPGWGWKSIPTWWPSIAGRARYAWALRKSIEPAMPHVPPLQHCHRALDKMLSYLLIPQFRTPRKRAEVAEAAPAHGEVRSGKPSLVFRGQRALGVGAPSRVCIVGVASHGQRVLQPEEAAKCEPA